MDRTLLERNTRLYRWHQTVAGALFWMPTTVLFLTEQLGLRTALAVQAAYYVAVVLVEVPSGWLSDRLGRVTAMRIVAVSWLAAHTLFILAPGPTVLVAAQILLATGYAFLSGTDVTFHYDTLEALDRAEEFEEREAGARQRLLVVTAATALAGGALGLADLRLPFVASILATGVQLAITMLLVEPGGRSGSPEPEPALGGVRPFARYLATPALAWLGCYVVGQVIVVHLIADLSGPYLADALDSPLSDPGDAALTTGAAAAAAAILGSLAVGRVPAVKRRIGTVWTLLVAAVIPTLVLGTMALVTAIWVVPLLALRGTQSAAAAVIAPAMVGAQVRREHRATFLSMMSLGGRLGFGAILLTLGLADASLETAVTVGASVALGLLAVTASMQRVAVDATELGDLPIPHRRHLHFHVHWGAHGHSHGDEGPRWLPHRHDHDHLAGASHDHD